MNPTGGIAGDVERAVGRWQRTADGVRASCAFPEDMAVLAGHFPDRPLVPGVHALELVLALAAREGPVPGGPLRIVSAKFARPIEPGRPFEVRLAVVRPTAGSLHLAATLHEQPQGTLLARISLEIGSPT